MVSRKEGRRFKKNKEGGKKKNIGRHKERDGHHVLGIKRRLLRRRGVSSQEKGGGQRSRSINRGPYLYPR